MIVVTAPSDGVVRITLNRPEKRNALSVVLRDEMSDTLDRLAGDEDVKAVIVTGSGSVFYAGFDLKEFEVDDADFRVHLVSAVVPDGEVVAAASAMAHEIAKAPRDILMRTKAKALARSGIDPSSLTLEL